jgi:hypothetical protein
MIYLKSVEEGMSVHTDILFKCPEYHNEITFVKQKKVQNIIKHAARRNNST